MSKSEIAWIVISICCCVVFIGFETIYFFLLAVGITFLAIALLTFVDRCRERKIQKEEELTEKRTKRLDCTITKIRREIDIDYTQYTQVNCEYICSDGKKYKFKSKKVLGQAKCKEGDFVEVMVEPEDYSNYFVRVQDVLAETPKSSPEK